MNKTKSLLALTTAAFIIVVTTTSASAFFHSSSYPAKEHGQGTEQKFVLPTAAFECLKVHLFSTGQANADSSQQKLAAEYVECTSSKPIEGKVTVKMEQCSFDFHQAKGAFEGTESIECPEGSAININAALGCVIKIGPSGNQNLKKWTGVNAGTTPNVIKGSVETGGITITVNSSCEIAGLKGSKEAKYTGPFTFEAQKDVNGEQVSFELV